MNIKLLIIFLFIQTLSCFSSNTDSTSTFKSKLFLDKIDSIDQLFFKNNALESNTINYKKIIKNIPDSIIKQRLKVLDTKTPLNIHFTPAVSKEIRRFLNSSPKNLAIWMGKSKYYFPLFDEVLEKNDIPLELKYLPVLESGLNPHARSNRGAKGLWQFMFHTGKENGLSINSYIDERADPIKATNAASKYFLKLHDIYEDWLLALAAYNSGPGNVNKALRAVKNKWDYWAIQPYLPKETQYYVPRFIALYYIFHYAEEHNISVKPPKYTYLQTEKIMIKRKIPLTFVSEITELSMEDILFLNPAYKLKIIPGSTIKQYPLILPVNKVGKWLNSSENLNKKLNSYVSSKKIHYPKVKELQEVQLSSLKRKKYTVKSGDVLGKIAQIYGVKVKDIQRWNGMRSTRLKIGRTLIIYTK